MVSLKSCLWIQVMHEGYEGNNILIRFLNVENIALELHLKLSAVYVHFLVYIIHTCLVCSTLWWCHVKNTPSKREDGVSKGMRSKKFLTPERTWLQHSYVWMSATKGWFVYLVLLSLGSSRHINTHDQSWRKMDGDDDDDDDNDDDDPPTHYMITPVLLTSTKLRTSNTYCHHRWATHVQKTLHFVPSYLKHLCHLGSGSWPKLSKPLGSPMKKNLEGLEMSKSVSNVAIPALHMCQYVACFSKNCTKLSIL